jgi:hypothetical protein
MSEENKQEEETNKEVNNKVKMIQNENIVFRHKIDPVTGEIIKE